MVVRAKPRLGADSNGHTALLITYLNIVLYALCYQLQRPVEPFLVKSLTEGAADAGAATVSQTYGRLQSFFSALQTLGSPLVGALLDRIGIRKTSSFVFLASAVSYGLLARATDLPMLFASKVPTMFQAAFLVAQATAATSTGGDSAARAQALGRMTTAYTIGATIGPALGGYLVEEKGDLYLGARLAVVGSLISVVLSLLFLTDSDDGGGGSSSPSGKEGKQSRTFVDEFWRSVNIASRTHMWPLLVIKVVGGTAASMHATALPLVLTQKLGFEPSQLGLAMSASSFAVAAFGAVCMAPLTEMLGSPELSKLGMLLRAVMEGVIAAIVGAGGQMPQVAAASVAHALASHALATSLTTQTTGGVDKSEQGALLGLEHSLFSLARIGGPYLGTSLLALGEGGFWSVALGCAAVDVTLVMALYFSGTGVVPAPKTRESVVASGVDDHSD